VGAHLKHLGETAAARNIAGRTNRGNSLLSCGRHHY